MKKSKMYLVLGGDEGVSILADVSDCSSQAYKELHKYCPACGCVSYGTTLMALYGDKNTNTATCSSCGWKCIVHNRVATRVKNPCQCKFCLRV